MKKLKELIFLFFNFYSLFFDVRSIGKFERCKRYVTPAFLRWNIDVWSIRMKIEFFWEFRTFAAVGDFPRSSWRSRSIDDTLAWRIFDVFRTGVFDVEVRV